MRLTLVVPTFDEGDEVRLAIERIIATLDAANLQFNLRVVVDGPNSSTERALRSIHDTRVTSEVLLSNMGKGFAVRSGLQRASDDVVGYIDGDLDISPDAIVDALSMLEADIQNQIGAIYGSKFHENSSVYYPPIRRVLSKGYQLLSKFLFKLDVVDTQTGLKIFRYDAIKNHIDGLTECDYLLDIELLAKIDKSRWRIHPVPVKIEYNYSTSVRASTVIQMLVQSFRLSWRLRRYRIQEHPQARTVK